MILQISKFPTLPHCVINVKLKRGVGPEHLETGSEQDPNQIREDLTIGQGPEQCPDVSKP